MTTEALMAAIETAPEIVPEAQTPQTALEAIRSDRFVAEVNASLPAHIDAATFVRHAATLVAQNPDLLKIAKGGNGTDPHSIVRGVARAAALGLDLDPTLGQAWLVARKVKGIHTAVFQPGYKGYLELVMRSGKVRRLEVERIHQNDQLDAVKGSNARLEFRPNWLSDRGGVVGWYALAELETGAFQWVVMSLAQMNEHRDLHGQSGEFGSWAKHFNAMADKTVFLKLARWLPKSTELAKAIAEDPDVIVDDDVIDVDDAEEVAA